MSSAISSFFLLLSTPLLLLNVEVPPFLVSWAIAFSYMYFCIWQVPVSAQNPTPRVRWRDCQALKSLKEMSCNSTENKRPNSEVSWSFRSSVVSYFTFYKKIFKNKKRYIASAYYVVNGPAPRTRERKVCCARNEWKARSLYRSWFKHLKRVRIALRIDSRSCYINPSSPPPPALFGFPPSSALFPLLAVGNHIHPCMENFLRLGEGGDEQRGDTASPVVTQDMTGALER